MPCKLGMTLVCGMTHCSSMFFLEGQQLCEVLHAEQSHLRVHVLVKCCEEHSKLCWKWEANN